MDPKKNNGKDTGPSVKVKKKAEYSSSSLERNNDHPYFCYFRTVMLVMPFVAMGITHSIKYTSIPELRIMLNASTQDISFAMAVGTLGGTIGGPLAGFADRFAHHGDVVVAASLLVITVTFGLLPFSPYLWTFGCLDAGFNLAWVLYQGAAHGVISTMWGPNGGSARYGIHFGYPIGSAIGPLIALPFLSDMDDSNDTTTGETQSYLFPVQDIFALFGDSSSYEDTIDDSTEESNIEIAYLIGSGIALALALIFALMYIFGPRGSWLYKSTLSDKSLSWKQVLSPRTWADGDIVCGTKIMVLMFLYYLFVLATIKGTQQYIVAYAVDSDLDFSSQEAATLNSLTFLMGTLARGLAIFAIKYIHITHMVILETHGLLLFAVLCLIFGTKYKVALWVLAPCLGFFRELLWPAGYAWTDNFIILFGVLVGLNDVVNGVSNFFVTSMQGYLYTSVGIDTVFYTTVGYGFLLCVLVHIMNFFGNQRGDRKNLLKETLEMKIEESTQL